MKLAEQLIATQGRCFLLSDISQMSGAPPETRRWAADWFRTHSITGGAMFGNSLPARTVLSLLARAVGLISGVALPRVFLKNEDEARLDRKPPQSSRLRLSHRPLIKL